LHLEMMLLAIWWHLGSSRIWAGWDATPPVPRRGLRRTWQSVVHHTKIVLPATASVNALMRESCQHLLIKWFGGFGSPADVLRLISP
jgi:hypothetical protein